MTVLSSINASFPELGTDWCSILNIFYLLSFGIIDGGETCASPESLPHASVDFELSELQENIPPQ
jgi:hypothetical protein